MNDAPKEAKKSPPEEAIFRPSRWPGLIWAVPLAALAIIGWLAIRTVAQSGPSVQVTFPVTGGLKPGTTKVEYQGYIVGQVGNVTLAKSLDQMKVQINFDAPMRGHLGPGTRYWIAGSSISLSDLSNIRNLIAGPVIVIDPRPGTTVRKVQGLSAPPVLTSPASGLRLTLFAPKLSNFSAGSPVFYKGYQLGQVLGVSLSPNGRQFAIQVFIDAPWQKLVRTDTRFWNAGAVRLSTGTGGPGVQLESVPALLMGAIAFETPSGPVAPLARDGTRFKLYDNETQAQNAPGVGAVPYRAIFPGGPHGLTAGAPVQLEGSPAGAVTDVALRYDPAESRLETVVTLTLQPQRVGLTAGAWNFADPAPQMNAMLSTLVAQGLRAEIGSSVPVVGGKMIALTLVKDAPPASLQAGAVPQIPAFGNGGDVNQIISQLDDILAGINAIPLDQIAADVHTATTQLAALASASQTKQTLRHLDQMVAHMDAITRQANAQLPAILTDVRGSAAQAQAALAAAQGLLNAQGPANPGPNDADLPHALYELSQAAKSLRALADFLDAHPGALIAGRQD
ncbi:MAG TPA: MlaD family protein [Acidocella sp.]|nr:MlaD family protein [Acidocella sp.]